MATKNHNLSQFDSPLPSAADMRFGIVVAEWNREVTEALLEGAVRTLRSAGCPDINIQIKYVPGTFELSLWRVSEHVVRTYISSNSDSARNHRQEAIVYYLKCVLFGLVSGWLESGMDDDILKELSEISELKHGSLADLLERI